ncbi:MAG TPA: S41 family peptidase [Longilinea sp.]|nr:S41 family peptidase [Longilinea sp.]
MSSRFVRNLLIGIIAGILLLGSFSGGVLVGWVLPKSSNSPSAPLEALNPTGDPNTGTPEDLTQTFKPFWETWDLVHKLYVDQPVDNTTLMRGAISGMLQSLGDAHTAYMTPDEYTQANTALGGEYEGIGAIVDITGDYLKIVSPMPDSPAEKAGIKVGDLIIAVDGQDMTGVDGELVLKKVKGPAGTPVILTIQRVGTDQPFDITVTRAKITQSSVTYKLLDSGIAYVALSTFGDNSTKDLKAALKDVLAQNPKGLVFDLRYNGGGYLNTAVEITSEFINSGYVLFEQYGDGTRTEFEALKGGLALDIPMVVLVNEGSASASEITAGALQDAGRAKLVGVTTYGKGTVQDWRALQDNQGAVRITIARWLTPKERQINGTGLTPDVEVKITDADIAAGRDPQLDKAVELLLQGK